MNINEYTCGQINRGTVLGEMIFSLIGRKDVLTILEIGPWNGLGTTRCVLDNLKDNQEFFSIELYPEMFDATIKNNKNRIKKNVHFLLGKIIDYNDVFWFDHSTIDLNDDHAKLWFQRDLDLLKSSENIIGKIPIKIDLLILDGGEYSTYPEWKKLYDRTSIVVLDDTKTRKCSLIRDELLKDSMFEIIYDDLNERIGCSIFEKVNKNDRTS